jgi:hypothetical protein
MKSRRGLGFLALLLGLGAEASGLAPAGSTESIVASATTLFGALMAAWGAIQAERPLGILDG